MTLRRIRLWLHERRWRRAYRRGEAPCCLRVEDAHALPPLPPRGSAPRQAPPRHERYS